MNKEKAPYLEKKRSQPELTFDAGFHAVRFTPLDTASYHTVDL